VFKKAGIMARNLLYGKWFVMENRDGAPGKKISGGGPQFWVLSGEYCQ